MEEIALRGPDDEIEIIVQFNHEVAENDLRILKDLDFTIIAQLHIIPAVFASGTARDIIRLSANQDIVWIEHNNRFTPALQETTGVIEATTPWTAEVKDGRYEDFVLNTQSQLSGLDGTGVTVVVVDTGIDGQHPDFDYGEKMIYNKHKNGADDPWIEKENADTSYGHGTHCAGIVAGNGDASGGSRRGVAPGANLIGLGGDWVPFPDESPIHWVVLEGLEWVYDNSRPGNNPHNIRVISNSWGGAGAYDPLDAITVISNKLTYENNVLVVFAAMNSGEGNHEGTVDTTSQQSKIPSVLSVAASTHDGEGMAVFSSRGQKGIYLTYPDITAPGVDIWATRPRGTWLGEYQLIDEDMYYMAISGTSMATPHVAGLAAILFQAAPSLRVSEHHDTYNGNDTSWGNRADTRIHEVEYILQMTADMIPYEGDNGVPADRDKGVSGRKMDFAQGYGLVNANHAVAVALTLEKMRQDEPDATVDDALKEYKDTIGYTKITEKTDTLVTSWRGEWAQLTNGSNPSSDTSFATDQHHEVFVPQSGVHLTIDLAYNTYDVNHLTGGRIDVTIDMDGDGMNDLAPQLLDIDGNKQYNIPLTEGLASENRGKFWTFNVRGEGIKIPTPNPEDEFTEALIEYTIGVELVIEPDARISLDEREFTPYKSPWRFGEPSEGYNTAEITLVKYEYDITDVEYQEPFLDRYGSSLAGIFIFLVIGMVILYGMMNRQQAEGLDGDDEHDHSGDPDFHGGRGGTPTHFDYSNEISGGGSAAGIGDGGGDSGGGNGDGRSGGRNNGSDGSSYDYSNDAINNGDDTGGADDPEEFDGTVEWEDPEA